MRRARIATAFPPTISAYQAAELFGVTPPTIYAWVREGEIPSISLGGRVRIPTAQVAALLGLEPADLVAADESQ